ncbi:antibiotic biosynthesis monooxygenase family protein [Poritiphilus flavus]|uniref:Antibiotic biosynthesis monooxygenase n=1 Tax=Poritiphilus flavus TaxID=2697053 RepID=A0A6L9ECU1_9FLAO|nr:antibiotic biosynthesis monooxygenase [Poritiphilus flavus]NAS12516.1 antibiotic biosynthesis monooxygenase [Poritiphilus flavus]
MNLERPYYAVIFTNTRTDVDKGYAEMAEQMELLAREQPGYLGFESARDGLGISVSYWKDQKSIADWKSQLDHQMAQQQGIKEWYSWYKVRVCLVEREYEFHKEP